MEYVRRFYRQVYGRKLACSGNGVDYWAKADSWFDLKYANGVAKELPRPDDLVVFSRGAADDTGHVAVVRTVNTSSVFVIQQNVVQTAADANFQLGLSVDKSTGAVTIKTDGGALHNYTVLGWLRSSTMGVPCEIKVTGPQAGNVLFQGQTIGISWSATGACASQVNVRFHQGPKHDGTDPIVTDVEAPGANDGTISGVVLKPSTFPTGSDYYVCVSEAGGTAGNCTGGFSIIEAAPPCSLAVTAPVAGSVFQQGDSAIITWTSTGACSTTAYVRIHKGPKGDGTDPFAVTIEGPGPNDGMASGVVLDSGLSRPALTTTFA